MADERRAAIPESAGDELARLRRLAVVEELLPALVGVLDLREVFTRVSEVAGRVLEHDAITLTVMTEDRQQAIPFATTGPAVAAYPHTHPILISSQRNVRSSPKRCRTPTSTSLRPPEPWA
jgi:hypothetical protein